MENQTWSTFTHENASYMLKVRVDGDVAIFLTDLRNIWIEHLSTEQLHQRFKELNKSFDFDLEECQKQVLVLIENVGKTVSATIEKDTSTVLNLTGKILDFLVTYNFQLTQCDQEVVSKNFYKQFMWQLKQFFAEVTLPLIKTVKLLEEQKKSMYDLLIQKDREISEYVLEKGDTISKKYLITEPFDATQIDNAKNCNTILDVFGISGQFWNNLSNEEEKPERPSKKLKTSTSKQNIKVYSAKTRKSSTLGIKFIKTEK